MKKEMMRLLTSVCLLAVLLALVACTKEEDDSNRHDSDNYTLNPEGNTDMYEIEPVDLSGYYSGVWWLDYTKVEPESLDYLWCEKGNMTDNYESYVSCVEYRLHNFYIDDTDFSSVRLGEFPFRPLLKTFLHLDEDIKYLTMLLHLGDPDREDRFLTSLSSNAIEKFSWTLGLPLNYIGYSGNMLYYDLYTSDGDAYLRLPFVVTLEENRFFNRYFGVVLDILPTKSTINVDLLAQSLTMSLVIKQIEVMDSDGQTSIVTPDKDIIITFASTQRSETPIKK